MSRNFQSNKPYCKVCHDAGKPESGYTSHWVKDRNGKTVCPTLLNTECRYCYKLGHTAKFCQVLAKNTQTNTQTNTQKKPINPYSVLNDESEEDLLSAKGPTPVSKPQIAILKTGWAAIAAKPREEKKVEEEQKFTVLKQSSTIVPKVGIYYPRSNKSWADLTDSEDEE